MLPIRSPRDIFDRDTLTRSIGKARSPEALRSQAGLLIREAFAHGRDVIRRRFQAEPRAAQAVAEGAFLADGIITLLYDLALPHFGRKTSVAVVATGGYGRSELFPYSDIDLLFLHDARSPPAKELAEWMLYGLWDLGVSVGHAVRTPAQTIDCAKGDTTIITNLLDARFLCGDRRLFDDFAHRFAATTKRHGDGDFIDAKLAERDKRHQRTGDSRYVLEPNLKEGKGGLRDLQTLAWLAKYIYGATTLAELVRLHLLTRDEYASFQQARDFLWRARMHLHLVARRAEERLTFDKQREVAEAMGYFDEGSARAQERFMKEYFRVARTVGNLTRSVCAMLEEDKKRTPRGALAARMEGVFEEPLYLDGGRLAVRGEEAFRKNPLLLVTLFETAHAWGLGIHPRTLQRISRNLPLVDARLRASKAANDAFLSILLSAKNPEPTLRRMSEAGVLGRFIPDFGRVVGQMQFDMYHVYTVDEHTIFAIGILHGIGAGKYAEEMPIATRVFPLVQSHRVLYLSLFAHDIAKGRGGDHSVIGETVVRKLARRFGFNPQETETCAWLVRYHLLMSRTAFTRDSGDPQTIGDFMRKVQSPERLRLLLILTVADIRAVGPHVWNGWKGALLRDLYHRTEEAMGASDVGSVKDETRGRIEQMLEEARQSGQTITLRTESDAFRAITTVLLCAPDGNGLFSRISGAIALCGANILSARIFTRTDDVAVEMFHIQDAQSRAFDRPDKIARLSVLIHKAVENTLDIAGEIDAQRLTYPSRMDVFKVPPRVLIENKASERHTVIEVSGRDRVGFLHMVTRVLSDLDLSISTAHISTYGERAVDVFYVTDARGLKITRKSKMRRIHDALIAALSAFKPLPSSARSRS